MEEFKTVDTGHPVSSMEINREGTILIVTYGKEVSFWDTSRYFTFFYLIHFQHEMEEVTSKLEMTVYSIIFISLALIM